MREAVEGSLDIGMARAYLASLRDQLPIFTIYDHPTDQPDFFVARMFVSLPAPAPSNFVIMDRDLGRLQVTMEALGLVKLMRDPADHPNVVESWI